MDAAIPLEQLPDEDRDRLSIPAVDDRGNPLRRRGLSLKATVPEEKLDRLRRRPSVDAERAHRGGLGLCAMLDAGRRVLERRDDPAHVVELVRDRRIQVEVALVPEAPL